MEVRQIFVKLLDGRTHCLQIPSPTLSGEHLKALLSEKTGIPFVLQRLVLGLCEISEETLLSSSDDGLFPSCALLLRLRGGKGGFGSLLRGAATKAGQKKTSNFDAYRDMSGRRLRHVNAEKRLEEWRAEAEERRLEKIAEEFIRKKEKEARKKKGGGDEEKYLEKYREDAAKCTEAVEESVRESFQLYKESKRKVLPAAGPNNKRLKIWLGKKKVDESDSDEEDDEGGDEDGDEKSVVLDAGSSEERVKENEGSPGSVFGAYSDGESSGGGGSEGGGESDRLGRDGEDAGLC